MCSNIISTTIFKYDDWDEIEEELQKQGFILDGIDEELFVQDIENFIASNSVNWDYVHPQTLFELLKKSGILDDDDKYEKAVIYCDIEGYTVLTALERSFAISG